MVNKLATDIAQGIVAKAKDELARRDLSTFVKLVFGYETYPHMKLWADLLSDESKSNLLIVAPPGHAKPVHEDSLVLMENGSRKKIKEIVVGERVISGSGYGRVVTATLAQGKLACRKITTNGGQTVIAALDHPFLTTEGWQTVEHLGIGDILAHNSTFQLIPDTDASIDEFKLAGYLLGDGCVTWGANYSLHAGFTNADEEVLNDFANCVGNLGFGLIERTKRGKATQLALSGGVRDWLRKRGLAGMGSWTKRVPEWAFRGNNAQIAALLGAYFMCDGTVVGKGHPNKSNFGLSFTSVSRGLLEDAQHLLLRLGIRARVRYKKSTYVYKGKRINNDCWYLDATSQDDVARFAAAIPTLSAKRERLMGKNAVVQRFDAHYRENKITEIVDVGEQPCCCITVDTDHTYTVNDLVCHNSSWISIFFASWYVGRHPERHIILLSNTADQALKPSVAVRDTVSGNPIYRRIFPKIIPNRGKGWGQDKWFVERPRLDDKDATMLSSGVPGPILGSRGDLIILDDVVDPENARTPEQRYKVKEFVTQTAFSRLNGSLCPRVVMICTRFHEEDLAAEFINDPEWTILHQPAIGDWTLTTGGVTEKIPQPADAALCPQIMSRGQLEKKRIELSRGGSLLWENMYQGNPSSPMGTMFKRVWWKFHPLEQYPQNFDMYIQSWDTANKSGSENDYSVGLGMGLYHGNIWIKEMFRRKMEFPELLRTTREFYHTSKPKPRLVLIEDKASGQALLQVLRSGANAEQGTLPTLPVKADSDALARVSAITGFVEAGRVWLPTGPGTDWVAALLDETAGFPNKAYDDIVMALTQGLAYLTKGDRFTPLSAGVIIHTETPSVEQTLDVGWGDLPGHEALGDFLRELN